MSYDLPEFTREEDRVARKPHKCCECHGEIPTDRVYHMITGKWNGEMEVFRFHRTCHALWEAFRAHEIANTDRSAEELCCIGGLIEAAREDADEGDYWPDYWPVGVWISSRALARHVEEVEGK